MNKFQKKTLAALVSSDVKWDCPLNHYTSFSIGGPADALVRVDKRDELQVLLRFLLEEKIQWRVIGRGTNLLIRDHGYPGVIVILGEEFQGISGAVGGDSDNVAMRAGGGCSLARLSLSCMERGLAGLEFACGIPGTVGGAVIMNAGAYGNELSSVVETLTLITVNGALEIPRSELDFGYRCWNDHKRFAGSSIVVEVKLSLKREESSKIRKYCRDLQGKRRNIQPNRYANAGSFFKNPVNESAGRLIEASGFKGVRVGGAMVSEKHANFLVNSGDATAADILALMSNIQEKVKIDSGIDLEPEVHII